MIMLMLCVFAQNAFAMKKQDLNFAETQKKRDAEIAKCRCEIVALEGDAQAMVSLAELYEKGLVSRFGADTLIFNTKYHQHIINIRTWSDELVAQTLRSFASQCSNIRIARINS